MILLAILSCMESFSQVAINSDGSSPDGSAGLEINFNDKGFLPPRLTEVQRDAISNPAAGLIIYCTSWSELQIFNGTNWVTINVSTAKAPCGQPIIDSRDSQSYNTVIIGSQCWMVENLNIGSMINISNNQSNNDTIEKYCYDNSTSNCDVYGGLYQWNEIMQYNTNEGSQGLCPDGWHIPSDLDWMKLEEEVESTTGTFWAASGYRGTDAGGNLKESGNTHWASPNTGATNSSGFTGLPGGYVNITPEFQHISIQSMFWTSSLFSVYPLYRNMMDNSAQMFRYYSYQNMGFSVRCIRD